MTSKIKILVGVLIVGVIIIGGLWIWKEYFLFIPGPVPGEVTLATDKTEYKQGEIIKITVKNDLNKPIWYIKEICPPSCCALHKLENNEWKSLGVPFPCVQFTYPGGIIEPDRLNPGEEIKKQLDTKGRDEFSESEKYRFSFYFGLSKDNYTEKTIYSNEFTIKEKIDETANWKIYRNEEHGYQVIFPKDWKRSSETAWSDIKNPYRSIEIYVTCKGDKTSEEWIFGKSTIYKDYIKLKDVTIEGIETVVLGESEQDPKTTLRRKIIFIPRNDYVYTIEAPYPFVSDKNFESILSNFKFTEIKEETLGWKPFWEGYKKKGCYDNYKLKCPSEKAFHFPNRISIPFTEGGACPTIGDFAEKDPVLHQILLEGKGAIEDTYRIVWGCRGEEWISTAIEIGYIDLTNDGEKDAIVMYRGGAAMRSHAVGIFQSKEGQYLKILDKNIRYSKFQVEKGQLVEIAPMYLFEEGECCPSNYAHIYYKFIGGGLKIEKILDNYGYDITEIYPTLRPCS